MDMDRQRKLVDLLYERSQEGILDWKETPVENRFQVSFATNGVQIEERGHDVNVYIIDGSGNRVDSFNDNSIRISGENYYAKMLEICNLARRKARNTEKVLDDILDELNHAPGRSR
jgi:hypothetical protein